MSPNPKRIGLASISNRITIMWTFWTIAPKNCVFMGVYGHPIFKAVFKSVVTINQRAPEGALFLL